MFTALFLLSQLAYARPIVIDFEAVEVTAERVAPSLKLVQESSHAPLQTTFTYQQLVGILRERLIDKIQKGPEFDEMARFYATELGIDVPDPETFSTIDMQIALYGSESVESLPVGIYEFNLYSSYSGEIETGHMVVERIGTQTQIKDMPSNKWCLPASHQRVTNPFTGDQIITMACADDDRQAGPFASSYIWNSTAGGIFEPASEAMLIQARALLETSHFTGWCPSGAENALEWQKMLHLCNFNLPSVQIYEVDSRSIADKNERIFVLGHPQLHVTVQSRFLGFLRYIEDPEREAQAAIDDYIQRRSEPGATVNPGDGQVYVCDNVSISRERDQLRFKYTGCKRPLSGWSDAMTASDLADEKKMTSPIGWTRSVPLEVIDLHRYTLGLPPVIEILR